MTNPRIVIADDHAETLALIASLLESEFDVVATVADGQAAVEATGALHPDVVVLDIAMPMLNGFEAAAVIRDLPDPPRIVSATAYDDAEFASAAFAHRRHRVGTEAEHVVDLVSAVRRALKFQGCISTKTPVTVSHGRQLHR